MISPQCIGNILLKVCQNFEDPTTFIAKVIIIVIGGI